MKLTDIPAKQAVPFGVNGQREALLPTTPAGDNKASYNNGFPPVTMILKSAGGIPPKGQDMNQILFELSSLCRWFSAGGAMPFDSSFCTAISGYPKGARVLGLDGYTIYISTIDSNTNDPNTSSDGWLTLSDYLLLGSGAPAIGIPFFWPSSSMPNTVIDEWSDMIFLKWNGASFSAAEYPKLAKVIPSLTLTESRGEFPRIWDDGRGVDSGRELMSFQGDAIRNFRSSMRTASGVALFERASTFTGAFTGEGAVQYAALSPSGSANEYPRDIILDPSLAVPTASENRPRNIAFNFLVRAK